MALKVLQKLGHPAAELGLADSRALQAGVEVDLIVEAAGKLLPIEVKLSATPRPTMASAIQTFQEDLKAKAGPGYVVHPGDVRLPLAPSVVALPFGEI